MWTINNYIISSVTHAFWSVLTYDLLEDRRIDDVIINTFLILYYIKQIDSKLPCICSVIDHRWRQNVVRTKKWHSKVKTVGNRLLIDQRREFLKLKFQVLPICHSLWWCLKRQLQKLIAVAIVYYQLSWWNQIILFYNPPINFHATPLASLRCAVQNQGTVITW